MRQVGCAAPIARIQQSRKKAYDVLDYVDAHDGAPPQGYEGGKLFGNNERLLPTDTQYREHDINPLVDPRRRGLERLVVGANKSAWYTLDHYESFRRMR